MLALLGRFRCRRKQPQNQTKTLVKGTIGLAVFSLFLEVNPSIFLNFLVFLGISYVLLLVHMTFKRSAVYRIDDDGIYVGRPFRREIRVTYENVQGLS